MDESIDGFVRSVKLESCRVINNPQLIFLCGGQTSKTADGPYLSARDYFYRYVKEKEPELAAKVRLAEEINNWFNQDTFADLLELEEYLADSSDLTILFVESPGSIAELGAFASSDSLRPRTLAVLNSDQPPDRTFIADGPVRRIRAHDKDLTRHYDWDMADPANPENLADFEYLSKDLIEYIKKRRAASGKERLLIRGSYGHTMLLIADLVFMIGITTATEINECLSAWKYTINKDTLRKYLVLLEHLKLVKRKLHSTTTYYLSTSKSPFIRYDFLLDAKVRDLDRIKNSIRTAISTRDQRRKRLFERELLGRNRRQRHV